MFFHRRIIGIKISLYVVRLFYIVFNKTIIIFILQIFASYQKDADLEQIQAHVGNLKEIAITMDKVLTKKTLI